MLVPKNVLAVINDLLCGRLEENQSPYSKGTLPVTKGWEVIRKIFFKKNYRVTRKHLWSNFVNQGA